MVAALAASTLMVAGCATETTYRPAPGQGFNRTGYSDRQIEPGRFWVDFAGNSVTSRDTVERYRLFRAAGLTL
ncbi:CC0125/CC1285 family lipoprotein, partial [Escherichia coli]|uniref:CC0125/CC1285 family lipoprotein n=1 Tax=Escherichia coli TaxID=562 RepID=UPI003FA1010E